MDIDRVLNVLIKYEWKVIMEGCVTNSKTAKFATKRDATKKARVAKKSPTKKEKFTDKTTAKKST